MDIAQIRSRLRQENSETKMNEIPLIIHPFNFKMTDDRSSEIKGCRPKTASDYLSISKSENLRRNLGINYHLAS